MTSSDELDIDHVPVRSGGHLRHLVFVSDLSEDESLGDGFVKEADGKIAWSTTSDGAARICAAAGHSAESYTFAGGEAFEDLALDLDGLVESVTSPLTFSAAERVFEAWQLFDGIAETVGEKLHQDESIYDRLADATGLNDGFIASSLKRPWRRAKDWTDADLEAMRRTMRSGLEMLARHIAPTASA